VVVVGVGTAAESKLKSGALAVVGGIFDVHGLASVPSSIVIEAIGVHVFASGLSGVQAGRSGGQAGTVHVLSSKALLPIAPGPDDVLTSEP